MRQRLLVLVYLIFAGGYGLLAWIHWGTPPSSISEFVLEEVNTDHENSMVELVSAMSWAIATALFALSFVRARRVQENIWRARWLLCFLLLCLVAFGEEVSWGAHWLGPDRFADYVNAPAIHNQRIGDVELVQYANPVFYAGLVLLWVALPILRTHRPFSRWAAFSAIPAPSAEVRLLFILDATVYLVLDRVFDAGHVFEASTGVVAILVAMSVRNDDA